MFGDPRDRETSPQTADNNPAPPSWMVLAQTALRRCSRLDEVLTTASTLAIEHCGFERAVILAARGGYLTADGSGICHDDASESLRRAVLARPIPLRGWNQESLLLRPGGRPPSQGRPPSVVAAALGLHHFVLAPMTPERDPIGLLVVDRSSGDVKPQDRAVVTTLGFMTAITVERLVLRQRLNDVKDELRHLAGAALGVVDELIDTPIQISPSDRIGAMFVGHDDVETTTGEGTSLAGLTQRENQIAQMLAGGLSNRAIASELHLSPDTVKGNVAAVLRKLGAGNRAEAVAKYLRGTTP